MCDILLRNGGKAKLSHYKPGQALRAPRISRQSAREGGKFISPKHRKCDILLYVLVVLRSQRSCAAMFSIHKLHVQPTQFICVLCGFEKKSCGCLHANTHCHTVSCWLGWITHRRTDGQTDPYRRSCGLSRNAATKIGKFAGALCDLSLQSRGSNARSARVD